MWKNTQWPIGFLWPQGPGFGPPCISIIFTTLWWCHDMKSFSTLLALCDWIPPGMWFPVTKSQWWGALVLFCCLPELTVWHHWLQTLLDSCHCKGHIITISFMISYFDDCHFNRALQINSPPGMQLIPSNRTTPSRQTGGIGVTVHSQRRVTIPIARWTVGWAR